MDYSTLYSGEHLKKIDSGWSYKKWSYRFTFESKMKYVMQYLSSLPKDAKILDAGCGQGLLVQHFKDKGYDIVGVDAFYGSEIVHKQDILQTNFESDSFDVILCLDVIEHFGLLEQEKLIAELGRVLKPSGKLVWSIPNMAHLSSRFAFMFLGRLMRTAKVAYHPGDRPIWEYYRLLEDNGLSVVKKKGLSATIPVLFQLTQLFPPQFKWLYVLLKPFELFHNWCFNVIVVCSKK